MLFVQYKKGNYAGLVGTTHFALQTETETAYLLSIEREEQYRGKGFGRILYSVVEDFCKDRGVKRIQLTFGHEKEEYWTSLGFRNVKNPRNKFRGVFGVLEHTRFAFAFSRVKAGSLCKQQILMY